MFGAFGASHCSPAGVLRFECFGFLMRVLHDVIHVAFHHKIFSNSQARTPVQLDALPLLYRLFIIIIIVVCIVSGENENQKSIHPLYKDDLVTTFSPNELRQTFSLASSIGRGQRSRAHLIESIIMCTFVRSQHAD